MKFIEVHYKFMSVGRDEVLFGVDGVWVVAIIGKEG